MSKLILKPWIHVLGAVLAGSIVSCAAGRLPAQDEHAVEMIKNDSRGPVIYTVSIPKPATQMIEMSITIPDVHADTIDVALPIWRPGRYVVLNPASTLRGLCGFDEQGEPLNVQKIRTSVWRISTNGSSTIRVDYRIYANSLGDRTRHVDDTHAFLSGESVFLYVVDDLKRACHVEFDIPEDWKIASGLEHNEADPGVLRAPDYDVLIDTPIELGEHEVIVFEAGGKPHEIVIWGDVEYDREQLVEDFTKLIEAQMKMWGSLPYERYVFLTHVGNGMGGGTEHLNSTILQTSNAALEGTVDNNDTYKRFLGLVSHEFFHTWNVKQLRPAGIVPYDYQRENYTTQLWVSEGTTSYYGDLFLARTGILKPKKYLDRLASGIDRFRKRPGRHVQSLHESSFDSWIKFSSRTPDSSNSTVSFYSKGLLVSLLLDMSIRDSSPGDENLDTAMQLLLDRYPLKQGGFSAKNFEDMAAQLSQADMTQFFEDAVRGTADLDFESALLEVGLELYFEPSKKKSKKDTAPKKEGDTDDALEEEPAILMKADLGVQVSGTRVRSVQTDSAAWNVGLMPGDEFLAIDGKRFEGSLDSQLEDHEPGDAITLTYFRRDELRELSITLGGVPDGSWKFRYVKEPTETQKASYKTWMWIPWPGDETDEVKEEEAATQETKEQKDDE